MIALLGGLGAAFCWACSALCATSASRELGAGSTLAWIMTLGLVLILPPLALVASFDELSTRTVVLLVVAGTTNVLGLAFEYRAFKLGKVGVVTAIASTEGMVTTVIAIGAGARASVTIFLLLVMISAGVALAAATPDVHPQGSRPGAARRVARLALPVPLAFGVSLFALGEIGSRVSVLWTLLPGRLVGVVAIGVPMVAQRRLKLTRRALPLLAAAATAEVIGFASFVWGSRSELSVAAVLASGFAALAAAGAYLLFRETLSERQLMGLAVVGAGVALLSLVRVG